MKTKVVKRIVTSIICLVAVSLTITRVFRWMDFPCDPGPCEAGEYLVKGSSDCLPCPNGFFMPITKHQCLNCKICSVVNAYNHEVLKKACTSTSDTEIVCKEGYYRYPYNSYWMVDNDCNICTRCNSHEVEVEACSEYKDTVCQANPRKGSELVLKKAYGGHD